MSLKGKHPSIITDRLLVPRFLHQHHHLTPDTSTDIHSPTFTSPTHSFCPQAQVEKMNLPVRDSTRAPHSKPVFLQRTSHHRFSTYSNPLGICFVSSPQQMPPIAQHVQILLNSYVLVFSKPSWHSTIRF